MLVDSSLLNQRIGLNLELISVLVTGRKPVAQLNSMSE